MKVPFLIFILTVVLVSCNNQNNNDFNQTNQNIEENDVTESIDDNLHTIVTDKYEIKVDKVWIKMENDIPEMEFEFVSATFSSKHFTTEFNLTSYPNDSFDDFSAHLQMIMDRKQKVDSDANNFETILSEIDTEPHITMFTFPAHTGDTTRNLRYWWNASDCYYILEFNLLDNEYNGDEVWIHRMVESFTIK